MTRSQKEGDIRPQRKVNATSPETDHGSGGRPAQITGKAALSASTWPDDGRPGGVAGSGMMSQGSSGDMGDPAGSSGDEEVDSDNLKKEGRGDGLPEVGPTHSRGVAGVTPGEPGRGALEGVGNCLQRDRDTPDGRRASQQVETRLKRIREEAKENKKWTFANLIHLVGDEEYLKDCFERLKKHKAAGVDRVTLEQYEENLDENIRALAEKIKRMSYIPQPVRRVYIPKSGGKRRPLGIPATEDKIVQVALARILDAIYEPRFCDGSYGFRNGRSCHDALVALDREIMTKHVNWVLDADIERFFDTVDHKWMVRCLEQKVKDLQVIRLVVRFLKAGVMEEGRYEETEQGTPQGGIISPILSNIYLHYVVDLWIEQVLRKECRGYVKEIRYADDFVLLFKYREDGAKAQKLLNDRLNKFGLKLSKEKTRLIEFGRFAGENARKRVERPATFDFLGFTHFVDRARSGKFKLGRKTSGKKFGAKVKALKEWIRNIRNRVSMPELWKLLRAKLLGHYSYYGISGNYPMLRVFYRRAVALVFKWLNRRSQRKSFSWPGLLIYIARYPLPQPKVYHRVYSLSRS